MQRYKALVQFKRGANTLPSQLSNSKLNEKFAVWMQKYEDFVGLSEVRLAHNRVIEAERRFVKSQEERREAQRQISTIQQKLQELHSELGRIPRGDDKYLDLITQEHAVIKDERRLRDEFQQIEKEERENFSALSHTVRDSHEKERAQAEKTKYWSIIGSILGTMLGIMGTTINNRLRMKELKDLVKDTASKNNHLPQFDVAVLSADISAAIKQSLTSKEDLPLSDSGEKRIQELMTSILDAVKAQNISHLKRNQELESALLLVSSGNSGDDNVPAVITGRMELQDMLDRQRTDFTRIVIVSSILVPLCTWALCKFVNL